MEKFTAALVLASLIDASTVVDMAKTWCPYDCKRKMGAELEKINSQCSFCLYNAEAKNSLPYTVLEPSEIISEPDTTNAIDHGWS